MKGNVIGFDPDTNTGAVSGHDGHRYDFATIDWRAQRQPRHGDVVDFQPEGQRATQMYLLEPEYVVPGFWPFCFSIAGRISRSQYWLRFMLPYLGICVALQIITALTRQGSAINILVSIVFFLFTLIAIWPNIAILVKRIHDRDKSGWLCLVLYVPTTLFIILLVAWLTSVIVAVAAGSSASIPSLGALGVIVIILGVASSGIALWFFIEFGCLRGTVGVNRFGPDPVR
ncbi:MAG TPA: DUF805 domain-containing protein [Stellaceae bacterium]|nr:DUF805 domain-containing protein [Stellaceae bacterium]